MNFEIRTLAEGEKISEPGFWNIPMHVHHSQPCIGPSVTSGVLRKMELATPADVWATHMLNPDRWPEQDKTALRLGRAMAAYVEGGEEEVSRHFAVLPEDKPRKPTAQQRAAYEEGRATDAGTLSVEFWDKVLADPRDFVTASEWQMISDMGKVLAADPAASAVMSGLPEISMVTQDPHTGIWILSRPDTVSFDGSMADYKKCNTQGRPFNYRICDRLIERHGYHQQMALAADTYAELTGERPSVVGLVFQWDAVPHHVIIREIDQEALAFGSFQNKRAIRRFAECLESGDWPGPGQDIGAFQMSDWMRTMLIEEMQIAGVAP